MTSSTVEDYLKRLYLEQQAGDGDGTVATGRLATAMGVTPGTATTMVKALASSGLVSYETRRGARLTDRGEHLALHVLRRHRLMEQFLVQVLGMDWAIVHEEAERLEHAISDRVLERIDAVLGHPQVDPHGDPIPGARGHVEIHSGGSLADCTIGAGRRIARIADQDPAFLRFAEREGLVPGANVMVLARDPAAGALLVETASGDTVSLAIAAAGHILLETTS